MARSPKENQLVKQITTVADLAEAVRTSRVASGTDQITAAGLSGVGVRFFGDLERGKSTVRLGLVLRVLSRLGLELWVVPRGQRPPGRQ